MRDIKRSGGAKVEPDGGSAPAVKQCALAVPKQNEDKLHEDQGDDRRPSCKIFPSTLIWLFW